MQFASRAQAKTRVYELRKADPAFASTSDDTEAIAYDLLEEAARRRTLDGISQPLVSADKIVRDDDGQLITKRCYPDSLLVALIKTHQRLQRNSVSDRRHCSRRPMPCTQ